MIKIEWIMFFWGGFLVAILLALMLFPLVHHRAVRLTRHRLEADIPVSVVEMQADKDRLRADFAISTRRLEIRVQQLRVKATTQLSEIGRNAAMINRLKSELVRKTVLADVLAGKVEVLTGKIEEAERERVRNLSEIVSAKRAHSAKELELVKSATDQRIEIDTRRVEIAALKTQIELYKSQADELQQDIASKTNELENRAGRIADQEKSLTKQERLLVQRAAEIKALFWEIAAIRKEVRTPRLASVRGAS